MKTMTAVGLVIGLTFLTGCAVSVEGPKAPASAPSAPTSVPEPSSSPEDQSTDESAQAADDSGDIEEGESRRSVYAPAIDITTGCSAGSLVLDQDNSTVRVTEACGKITIAASSVHVLAERVDSLVILSQAACNVVLVRSAGSVVISGDNNFVYWDQGAPKTVRVTGGSNKVGPNPTPEP